jgi:hypothetical protein
LDRVSEKNQREEDSMELLMVLSLHFFTMGTWVLIISGILSFMFPRLKFIFIVLVGMLFSYIYTMKLESFGLNACAVIFSGMISLLAITLVRLGFYAKNKAEKLSKDEY